MNGEMLIASSKNPIKKMNVPPKSRGNLRSKFTLKTIKTSEKAIKNANPPPRGVGMVCDFRLLGKSIAPTKFDNAVEVGNRQYDTKLVIKHAKK